MLNNWKNVIFACLIPFFLWGDEARADLICPTEMEGAIRYNQDVDLLEFCDGSMWIAIRTEPADTGSPTCTTAERGRFFFNSTHGIMQYCDGTYWRHIGKKPASMPATPTCSDPGNIRYNQDRKTPVYCDGNHYVAMSSLFVEDMTSTVDVTPPNLIESNPNHDQELVTLSPNIYLIFDEPVRANNAGATIRIMEGASVVASFTMGTEVMGLGTSTLMIQPSPPLIAGRSYHIEIDATAIEDMSGNAFAGITDDSVLRFTVATMNCSNVANLIPANIGYICNDGAVYIGDVASRPIFAAPEDEASVMMWKTSITTTAGTASSRDGSINRAAMETAGLSDHPAMQACATRGTGWYLPAQEELDLVYDARDLSILAGTFTTDGGWPNSFYWSSTQTQNYAASYKSFANGNTATFGPKTYELSVRCVRGVIAPVVTACTTGLVTNANTVCLGNGVDLCPGSLYRCQSGELVTYIGQSGSNHLFTTYAGFEPLQWKTSATDTPGTSSETDGMTNTNALANSTHPAGKACRDLGSQWFLPAKDELNALYTLSSSSPLLAMVRLANNYWSSTQHSATHAWDQVLSSGTQNNHYTEVNYFSVRCLRR